MDTFSKIRKLMANEVFVKEEEIHLDSELIRDLGINSIEFYSYIGLLENTFDIEIDDETIHNMVTVEDVVNAVDRLQKSEKSQKQQLKGKGNMSIIDEIKEMIHTKFGIDKEKIKAYSNLKNDLGLCSIEFAELCFSLETYFDFEITDEEADDVETVNDLAVMIEKKLALESCTEL